MASLDVEGKFEILKSKFDFPFSRLKPKQIRMINFILSGQSCMGLFPTGYGKSIMFLLPPLLANGFGLIISPLKSIMNDQLRQLNAMNITAVIIGPDTTVAERKGIRNGDYTILLCAPEVLERMGRWRDDLWDNHIYTNSITVIAVDEAHLMHTWADQFRPAYNRVVEVRSFFTKAPLLLLSATCTPQMRQTICNKLGLDSVHVEWELPNRPNIFINIKHETGMEFSSELEWYMDHLLEKKYDADKALLYVSGVSQMSRLALDVVAALGPDHRDLFALYHAGMDGNDLKEILREFSQTTSKKRLIVCTIALGIGVNIPDVKYVIHWGICKSIDDYWQEVGRAGRDGRKAVGMMYATYKSLQHVSDDMKDLVKTNECYRKFVLDKLSVEATFQAPTRNCSGRCLSDCHCDLCLCCSNCKKMCSC